MADDLKNMQDYARRNRAKAIDEQETGVAATPAPAPAGGMSQTAFAGKPKGDMTPAQREQLVKLLKARGRD